MAEKRRDSRGRILRTGEVQRPDGKYMYRYTDLDGERQTVYSWKLVESDRVPEGKQSSFALRTKIAEIERDLQDGIRPKDAGQYTLNMLFDDFMDTRTDLKVSTRCNYKCLYNTHVRDTIGRRTLKQLKYTDFLKFYIGLNRDEGLKISTIQAINSAIWQPLNNAVKDDIIRKNPADGVMREVKRKINDEPNRRDALTKEQQEKFIDYIRHSDQFSRYENLFIVLLGTGMRIGECLGLRWCDVDFDRNVIVVDHALSYKDTEDGVYEYSISRPKTLSGIREIPMFQDVSKALQREKAKKRNPSWEQFRIGKYTGFVFLNANGKPFTPSAIFDKIQTIVVSCNQEEQLAANLENRKPCYIPKISPHILRHTFCTRMCEVERNSKVVQEVMGHKNLRTTMDVYNNLTSETKRASFSAIDGSIYLG